MRIGLIVVLMLIVAAASFGARPIYNKIKASRAEGFADEAQALLDRKSYPEATRKLSAALQIKPQEPRFLRIAAKLYTAQRSPLALRYYRDLLATPQATDEDRYEFIQTALLMGQTDAAEAVIRRLVAKEPVSGKTYFFAALASERRRDLPRAIQFARSAIEKSPTERDYKYLMGRLLLASTSPADNAEGKKLLFDIAAKDDSGRNQAIRLLGAADLSPQEMQQLITWVKQDKDPSIEDYFLAAELLYKSDTNALKTIASQAVAKFKGGKAEEQVALGTWLNRHKLFEETTLAVSPDKDIKNVSLSMVYLDALSGAQKWQEAVNFLSKSDLAIEPVFLETLRASAAVKLKKDDLAQIHWKKAMQLAGEKVEQIRLVADVAERAEAYEVALAGYRRVATNPATEASARQAILRIKSRSGDTRGVRDYVRELLEKAKHDTALQNFNAYLSLLLNEDVAKSRATVESLHYQQPSDLGFRVSLALGHLREKNAQAAMNVFGTNTYNLAQFPPGARAVYAAVLGAANKDKEAENVVRTISLKDLKPEERELIKSWANVAQK